jgi:hypothetical protein
VCVCARACVCAFVCQYNARVSDKCVPHKVDDAGLDPIVLFIFITD